MMSNVFIYGSPDNGRTIYFIDVKNNICNYFSGPGRFGHTFRVKKLIKDIEIPADLDWKIVYEKSI